jgi:hypothetical protein
LPQRRAVPAAPVTRTTVTAKVPTATPTPQCTNGRRTTHIRRKVRREASVVTSTARGWPAPPVPSGSSTATRHGCGIELVNRRVDQGNRRIHRRTRGYSRHRGADIDFLRFFARSGVLPISTREVRGFVGAAAREVGRVFSYTEPALLALRIGTHARHREQRPGRQSAHGSGAEYTKAHHKVAKAAKGESKGERKWPSSIKK